MGFAFFARTYVERPAQRWIEKLAAGRKSGDGSASVDRRIIPRLISAPLGTGTTAAGIWPRSPWRSHRTVGEGAASRIGGYGGIASTGISVVASIMVARLQQTVSPKPAEDIRIDSGCVTYAIELWICGRKHF
jgi:hypothetical protein